MEESIDPSEQTPYNIESSDETTEEILNFNKLFETAGFDNQVFEEAKDEIELNSVSVFIDKNSDVTNFANDLIKLDIYDPNYNLNLLRLIKNSNVIVTEEFHNNLTNNILENIETIETYDPKMESYFQKPVDDIISKFGKDIDLSNKENSDKLIEEIKENANILEKDSRLKKLRELPWGRILGGIFAFSAWTITVILLTYYYIKNNNSNKQNALIYLNKKYSFENFDNNLKIYNTIYLFSILSKLISGCYMITDKNVIRLDDCSEFYKDPKNISKCSCKNISNNVCNKENCDYPYCIGTSNCANNIKCTNKLNIPINFCNETLGNNFVYYIYQSLPKFSLGLINKSLKNAVSNKNSSKKNNYLKIIFIIFISIILLGLFIFFYNYITKKKRI